MNPRLFAICALSALAAGSVHAGDSAKSASASDRARAHPVDLATSLRLAGAQNLDVKLAAERTALARAEHLLAKELFFPWVTVGGGYQGHQENIQAVDGTIIDAEKSAVNATAAVKLQLDLGNAYFKTLSAQQLVKAAAYNSDAELQDAVETAALAYFELVKAQAFVGVAAEAVHISADYEGQLKRAVDAGIAFAGDAYRIQTELNTTGSPIARPWKRAAWPRLFWQKCSTSTRP
jgi:outer membrane protein TolC